MSSQKLLAIELFMTREDEKAFSRLIKDEIKSVYFMDNYAWTSPSPIVKNSIDECYGAGNSSVAIINKDIVDLDYYKNNYIKEIGGTGYFHGGTIGDGMIKFLHSEYASYTPGGLMNGALMASYDSVKSPETDAFVKAVWRLCKKHALKLYPITDMETGTVSSKPHSKFLAWPDAVAKFDQVDGMYLTNNTMAYLTSKRG